MNGPEDQRVQRIIEIAVTAPDEEQVRTIHDRITVMLADVLRETPGTIVEVRLIPSLKNFDFDINPPTIR